MTTFLMILLVMATFAFAFIGVVFSREYFGSRLYIFSPPLVACVYYLLRSYPGVIDAAFELGNPEPVLAVLVAAVGLSSGVGVLTIFERRRSGAPYIDSVSHLHESVVWTPIIIGFLSVAITFAMLGRIPFVYLLQDIFGSGAEVSMHEARRMNTLEHRAGDTVYFGQGYFRLLYMNIAPVFVAILYIYKKNAGLSLLLPRFLMVLFCLFAGMNGQIWPIVNTIIFFLVVAFSSDYFLVSNAESCPRVGSLVFRSSVALALVIGFIFLYRYAQYLSGRHFENFFLETFRRIYSADTAKLFVMFPELYPFRSGDTWINDLLGFLPGSTQSFSYEVHYLLHGGAWGFTAAPGLFASAYVNFGMMGVFVLFFFAILIYSFFYRLNVISGRSEDFVLAVTLSVNFAIALSADITSLILPFFILIGVKLVASLVCFILRVPRVRVWL